MMREKNGTMDMFASLVLYQEYSRSQLHDIIEPQSNFTPGSGTWGLQGIINVGKKNNYFIFFVTYGQKQAGHKFQEGITNDGILSWQSQPKQGFQSLHVQTWINQQETNCLISLFVRNSKKKDYIYLGELEYLSHEKEKEFPVHFEFQIKNWRLIPHVQTLINPMKVNTSNAKRDAQIVQMIDEEGRKQTAISKSLKMSTQRIQQIYKQEIRSNVAKDFFHVGETVEVIKLHEGEPGLKYAFERRKDPFDPYFFHKGEVIKVIKTAKAETTKEILEETSNSKLKELINLHPEILGTGEGVELEYDYETTSGVKIPLVMHGTGKLKTVVDYTDKDHDSSVFKAASNLVLMSVALAVEQERSINCPDVERILIASYKPGPVTLKFAKLYSVKLVDLS